MEGIYHEDKIIIFLQYSVLLVLFSFLFFSCDSRAGIEDSKKWGMLFLVNQLFKIYFKVGFKSGKLCFVFHILSQTHPVCVMYYLHSLSKMPYFVFLTDQQTPSM